MSELWQRMLAGAESLGTIVPALIGAGVILLTGYFLARQIEKWTDHLLKKWSSTRWRRRADSPMRWSGRYPARSVHAIGKLLFWLVMLVVILLSATALGLRASTRCSA
jgi:hypothetical protein